MSYIANQVTVEGLTKSEIIGAIGYVNECLARENEMEAWEVKEYKASLEHFTNDLKTLTNNYNELVLRGVNPVY